LDAANHKFTPFVWTDDDELGVVSFTECFERWTEKAKEDKTINLMDIFGLTWDNLKSPDVAENFFKRGGPRGNRGKLTKERNGVDGKYEGHDKRRVD
tara:strand:- start:183 stop:473 length:291 start_codon:yes stop_codon:yes gene_type:complete